MMGVGTLQAVGMSVLLYVPELLGSRPADALPAAPHRGCSSSGRWRAFPWQSARGSPAHRAARASLPLAARRSGPRRGNQAGQSHPCTEPAPGPRTASPAARLPVCGPHPCPGHGPCLPRSPCSAPGCSGKGLREMGSAILTSPADLGSSSVLRTLWPLL